MSMPSDSRKMVRVRAIQLPRVESISPRDDRLKPRQRTPAREGQPIVTYIETLAAEIIRNQRTASRAFLAEAALLLEHLHGGGAGEVQDTEGMRRVQKHLSKAHQAWRRKDIDDITMSVLRDCYGKVRGHRDYIEMAGYLHALHTRIEIDAAVAGWCDIEGDP